MAHPPYDPCYLSPPHIPPPPAPPPPPQYHHHLQLDNGVNTLFVSGLPDDVKAREIHNLFRRKPGFDSCQLKYTGRGNQVVAFATFFNHQSAIAAMHALSGVKFDPRTGSILHIELARSNSRKKRKPGNDAYVVTDNRNKPVANTQETSSADGDSDSDEASLRDNVDAANKGVSVTPNSEKAADPGNAVAPAIVEQSDKTSEGGVQPCSTLFTANLGPNCTEDELKQAFSVYPGFSLLKTHARGGMPVAFADFEEVEQASKAMQELQDSTLPSSNRGMQGPKCGGSSRERIEANNFLCPGKSSAIFIAFYGAFLTQTSLVIITHPELRIELMYPIVYSCPN